MRTSDRCIRRRVWGPIVLGLMAGTGPVGLAQSPPTPSPSTPPADEAAESPTPAELMRKFREMEAANRKLLEEVRKLSQENQKLSKEVKDLSKKVEKTSGEGSKKVEKTSGEGSKEGAKHDREKTDSGLAGQVDWENIAEGGEGPLGAQDPASGERASGLRSIAAAEGRGNRHLGKIPLKAFYDYGNRGVGLSTLDDEFLLKFRAELQADSLDYLGPPQSPVHSGVYLPRVRYYFQGHFTKPIDYQLSFQRSYTTFGFLNAFLNFNYDSRLQFRIGRFKAPFTYEWYKLNNFRLITPERSLFSMNLGLNRMTGLMGWGGLLDNRLEYAVGMFAGPRNSSTDYNAAKDIVAFLNFRPFELAEPGSLLKNLNIGGSVDAGRQDNPAQPSVLRTSANASSAALSDNEPINNATVPFLAFNNNVRERGNRELWELHLAYYYNGLSLYTGWGSGFDSFAANGQSPVRLPVSGYHVTAAYLITGETLSERTVVDPIHRFDLRPGKFGLGAFEPFARYSELNIGNQIFRMGLADPNLWTDRVRMTDVGVNWYLNRAVKIYFDWEHAMFGRPIYYRPGGFRSVNDLLWLRFQLYF